MEKILLVRLHILAIFFGISAGVLTLGIVVVSQFYFLKIVYSSFWLLNGLFALIIAGIVLTICLSYIWIRNYCDNKYRSDYTRAMRKSFFINFLFSPFPIWTGLIFIKMLGDKITSSEQLNPMADIFNMFQHKHTEFYFFIILFLGMLFFVNITIYLLINFGILVTNKMNLELENANLNVKVMEADFQRLNQQIQPHFLFNSLNTLKTLIRKQPENAEVYLKRLSDLLRASVTNNENNLSELKEELKLCIDYMEIQRVRFGEALQFVIDIPEEVCSGLVPGFSVQSVLENAIKHNVFTKERPLLVSVKYKDGYLVVSNNKQKKMIARSTGTGLKNLSERYRIISGDKIIIHDEEDIFSVTMKVMSGSLDR